MLASIVQHCDGVPDNDVAVCVATGVRVVVSEADAETEALPVHELETLPDGETEADGEPLTVTVADGVRV